MLTLILCVRNPTIFPPSVFPDGQFQGQGQPFPNPFSLLGGQAAAGGPGQLFSQGLWGQPTAQGQDALAQQVPVGQGAFGQQANAGQLPPGSFAQPLFPQGQGVQHFPQGQQGAGTGAGIQGISVGADGQLTAGGKPIGRMYPTSHGTVIVITKQPGQQQSLVSEHGVVGAVWEEEGVCGWVGKGGERVDCCSCSCGSVARCY